MTSAGLPLRAGLAFVAVLLLGAAAPAAAAPPIALTLRARGAVADKVSLTSTADDAHLCALIGASGGPQTYLFLFNKAPSDAMLDPRRPGLFVTVAAAGAARRAPGDRSAGTIQVSIGGRHFLGLGQADPSFRLHVSFRPDGTGGRFTATHLVDPAGSAAVDVQGSWSCPLGARGTSASASAPAAAPATGAAPPSVRPASVAQLTVPLAPATPAAEPESAAEAARSGHFRLIRSRARCRDSCPVWLAVDPDSGKHFDTTADFSPVSLAPRLAAEARSGQIDLLITGEVRPPANSRLAQIRVERLDGVTPHAAGHGGRPRSHPKPQG